MVGQGRASLRRRRASVAGSDRPDGRARILSEATRCFARRGLDGTSLQEIADAAGMRKPSLLHHFPSKEALYQSVLEHLLSSFGETLPRLLKAAAREDRFDAILDETLTFFAADQNRARLLLREALDHPEQMRELVRTQAMPWMSIIVDSIRKAQRDKSMRAGADPEAYLVQVVNMVVGLFSAGPIMHALVGGKRQAIDERLVKELKRVARIALIE